MVASELDSEVELESELEVFDEDESADVASRFHQFSTPLELQEIKLYSQTVLPMDPQISLKAARAAFSYSAVLQADLISL